MRWSCLLYLALALPSGAHAATEPTRDDVPVVAERKPHHPNPRLKLSYRRFAIANLDGTPMWLDGAELDAYALSRRWVRAGFELEGGGGHASLEGNGATLGYGLAGANVGFQYPWRVTPFVEGRFAGGVLSGNFDGTVTVPGTNVSMSNASEVTWMYGGGLDVGAEFYTVKRLYLSAAVGWVRTTWHGLDVAAMQNDPLGGLRYKDLTGDSFTLKVGFGI